MRALVAFILLFFSAAPAFAQSVCPPLNYGLVLTAAQWQACFAAKQDIFGYTPVNKAGDVMLGRLVTAAPSPTRAGLNMTPGTTPSAPVNGDIWVTSSGAYVQINGSTVGPLQGVGSAASFAATAPLTVSFPAGVTTYGVNFSQANTWLGGQTFSGGASFASSFSAPGLVNLADFAPGTMDTVLGYFASTSLAARSLPSCSTASSGLTYNTTTHNFGCNSSLGGVSSLNSLTGALSIVAGAGVSVTPSSPNITVGLTTARQTLPSITTFNSGSGTYTTPANALWIDVMLVGGGGGGGGGNNTTPATDGGSSCLAASGAACTSSLLSSGGGTGGSSNNPGNGGVVGGTLSCGVLSVGGSAGGNGNISSASVSAQGGSGGVSSIGGAGTGGRSNTVNAVAAAANSGSGGGGGGQSATTPANAGNGGGSSATCRTIITSPAASYTYAVGAAGSGASAGTNGGAGSNGGAGTIVIIAHFGS